MEGLDVQVPGHSAAYTLVKSSSGAHIGFAFIRKDQVHNMVNGQGIYAGLIRGNNIYAI